MADCSRCVKLVQKIKSKEKALEHSNQRYALYKELCSNIDFRALKKEKEKKKESEKREDKAIQCFLEECSSSNAILLLNQKNEHEKLIEELLSLRTTVAELKRDLPYSEVKNAHLEFVNKQLCSYHNQIELTLEEFKRNLKCVVTTLLKYEPKSAKAKACIEFISNIGREPISRQLKNIKLSEDEPGIKKICDDLLNHNHSPGDSTSSISSGIGSDISDITPVNSGSSVLLSIDSAIDTDEEINQGISQSKNVDSQIDIDCLKKTKITSKETDVKNNLGSQDFNFEDFFEKPLLSSTEDNINFENNNIIESLILPSSNVSLIDPTEDLRQFDLDSSLPDSTLGNISCSIFNIFPDNIEPELTLENNPESSSDGCISETRDGNIESIIEQNFTKDIHKDRDDLNITCRDSDSRCIPPRSESCDIVTMESTANNIPETSMSDDSKSSDATSDSSLEKPEVNGELNTLDKKSLKENMIEFPKNIASNKTSHNNYTPNSIQFKINSKKGCVIANKNVLIHSKNANDTTISRNLEIKKVQEHIPDEIVLQANSEESFNHFDSSCHKPDLICDSNLVSKHIIQPTSEDFSAEKESKIPELELPSEQSVSPIFENTISSNSKKLFSSDKNLKSDEAGKSIPKDFSNSTLKESTKTSSTTSVESSQTSDISRPNTVNNSDISSDNEISSSLTLTEVNMSSQAVPELISPIKSLRNFIDDSSDIEVVEQNMAGNDSVQNNVLDKFSKKTCNFKPFNNSIIKEPILIKLNEKCEPRHKDPGPSANTSIDVIFGEKKSDRLGKSVSSSKCQSSIFYGHDENGLRQPLDNAGASEKNLLNTSNAVNFDLSVKAGSSKCQSSLSGGSGEKRSRQFNEIPGSSEKIPLTTSSAYIFGGKKSDFLNKTGSNKFQSSLFVDCSENRLRQSNENLGSFGIPKTKVFNQNNDTYKIKSEFYPSPLENTCHSYWYRDTRHPRCFDLNTSLDYSHNEIFDGPGHNESYKMKYINYSPCSIAENGNSYYYQNLYRGPSNKLVIEKPQVFSCTKNYRNTSLPCCCRQNIFNEGDKPSEDVLWSTWQVKRTDDPSLKRGGLSFLPPSYSFHSAVDDDPPKNFDEEDLLSRPVFPQIAHRNMDINVGGLTNKLKAVSLHAPSGSENTPQLVTNYFSEAIKELSFGSNKSLFTEHTSYANTFSTARSDILSSGLSFVPTSPSLNKVLPKINSDPFQEVNKRLFTAPNESTIMIEKQNENKIMSSSNNTKSLFLNTTKNGSNVEKQQVNLCNPFLISSKNNSTKTIKVVPSNINGSVEINLSGSNISSSKIHQHLASSSLCKKSDSFFINDTIKNKIKHDEIIKPSIKPSTTTSEKIPSVTSPRNDECLRNNSCENDNDACKSIRDVGESNKITLPVSSIFEVHRTTIPQASSSKNKGADEVCSVFKNNVEFIEPNSNSIEHNNKLVTKEQSTFHTTVIDQDSTLLESDDEVNKPAKKRKISHFSPLDISTTNDEQGKQNLFILQKTTHVVDPVVVSRNSKSPKPIECSPKIFEKKSSQKESNLVFNKNFTVDNCDEIKMDHDSNCSVNTKHNEMYDDNTSSKSPLKRKSKRIVKMKFSSISLGSKTVHSTNNELLKIDIEKDDSLEKTSSKLSENSNISSTLNSMVNDENNHSSHSSETADIKDVQHSDSSPVRSIKKRISHFSNLKKDTQKDDMHLIVNGNLSKPNMHQGINILSPKKSPPKVKSDILINECKSDKTKNISSTTETGKVVHTESTFKVPSIQPVKKNKKKDTTVPPSIEEENMIKKVFEEMITIISPLTPLADHESFNEESIENTIEDEDDRTLAFQQQKTIIKFETVQFDESKGDDRDMDVAPNTPVLADSFDTFDSKDNQCTEKENEIRDRLKRKENHSKIEEQKVNPEQSVEDEDMVVVSNSTIVGDSLHTFDAVDNQCTEKETRIRNTLKPRKTKKNLRKVRVQKVIPEQSVEDEEIVVVSSSPVVGDSLHTFDAVDSQCTEKETSIRSSLKPRKTINKLSKIQVQKVIPEQSVEDEEIVVVSSSAVEGDSLHTFDAVDNQCTGKETSIRNSLKPRKTIKNLSKIQVQKVIPEQFVKDEEIVVSSSFIVSDSLHTFDAVDSQCTEKEASIRNSLKPRNAKKNHSKIQKQKVILEQSVDEDMVVLPNSPIVGDSFHTFDAEDNQSTEKEASIRNSLIPKKTKIFHSKIQEQKVKPEQSVDEDMVVVSNSPIVGDSFHTFDAEDNQSTEKETCIRSSLKPRKTYSRQKRTILEKESLTRPQVELPLDLPNFQRKGNDLSLVITKNNDLPGSSGDFRILKEEISEVSNIDINLHKTSRTVKTECEVVKPINDVSSPKLVPEILPSTTICGNTELQQDFSESIGKSTIQKSPVDCLDIKLERPKNARVSSRSLRSISSIINQNDDSENMQMETSEVKPQLHRIPQIVHFNRNSISKMNVRQNTSSTKIELSDRNNSIYESNDIENVKTTTNSGNYEVKSTNISKISPVIPGFYTDISTTIVEDPVTFNDATNECTSDVKKEKCNIINNKRQFNELIQDDNEFQFIGEPSRKKQKPDRFVKIIDCKEDLFYSVLKHVTTSGNKQLKNIQTVNDKINQTLEKTILKKEITNLINSSEDRFIALNRVAKFMKLQSTFEIKPKTFVMAICEVLTEDNATVTNKMPFMSNAIISCTGVTMAYVGPHTNEFLLEVLRGIEESLGSYHDKRLSIGMAVKLITYYTTLCRSYSLEQRMKLTIMDILYSKPIKFHGIFVKVLQIWPEILVNSNTCFSEDCLLTQTIISILVTSNSDGLLFPNDVATMYSVANLKFILKKKYGYVCDQFTYKQIQIADKSIERILEEGSKRALILLCHSYGLDWSKTIVEKKLFPILRDWIIGNVSNEVAIDVIMTTGIIIRGMPAGKALLFIKQSMDLFEEVLHKSPDEYFTEKVVEALSLLRRHNIRMLATILMRYTPPTNHATENTFVYVRRILSAQKLDQWLKMYSSYKKNC